MILAYIGPETALPVSSALAVAAGAIMAFWPKVKQTALAVIPRALRKSPPATQPPASATAPAVDEDTRLPQEISSLAGKATDEPTSLPCS